MELTSNQEAWHTFRAFHYHGSLDWVCTFCKSKSYNNFHFEKDRKNLLVICKDCINKLMDEVKKDGTNS